MEAMQLYRMVANILAVVGFLYILDNYWLKTLSSIFF